MKNKKYKGLVSKWRNGTVLWFDESSGEGMILDKEDGTSYYVHRSAIRSKQKLKKLEKDKEVKFKLYETSFLKQVDEVKEDSKESKRISSKSKKVVLYEWGMVEMLPTQHAIVLSDKSKWLNPKEQYFAIIKYSNDRT